ncbi:MAG TPA: hypothetical protein PLU58_08570 [Saprospiraceae bacterium]|nr:hypothetical protein [Saprospiraceae bacterium]HQW95842.1 hypothetical protein [Saprospiraceae bacterium]
MIELISIRTFLAEYISRTDIEQENLDELVVLNFASSSVQRLQNDKQCNHKVQLIPVHNYNFKRPIDFNKIIEIAYRSDVPSKQNRLMWRDEVISYTSQNFAGCDVKIEIECPKCHSHMCSCGDDNVVFKVDDDWLASNSERHYWNNPRYLGVYGLNKQQYSSFYHPSFVLVRPAMHKFFGANYHVRGCINLDARLKGKYPIEYKIDNSLENKYIRLNVETGTVLLSYLANQSDDEGYPLIPNDPEIFEAIFWDVEYKMLYRNKRKSKDNYQLSMNAKKLADIHMLQAKEKIDSISPLEWASIGRNYFKKISYNNMESQAERVISDRFYGLLNRVK